MRLAAFKKPARDSFADDQRRDVSVRARYHGHDRSVSDVRVVEAVNFSPRIDDRILKRSPANPSLPHRMVVVPAIGPDERCDVGAGRAGDSQVQSPCPQVATGWASRLSHVQARFRLRAPASPSPRYLTGSDGREWALRRGPRSSGSARRASVASFTPLQLSIASRLELCKRVRQPIDAWIERLAHCEEHAFALGCSSGIK